MSQLKQRVALFKQNKGHLRIISHIPVQVFLPPLCMRLLLPLLPLREVVVES